MSTLTQHKLAMVETYSRSWFSLGRLHMEGEIPPYGGDKCRGTKHSLGGLMRGA